MKECVYSLTHSTRPCRFCENIGHEFLCMDWFRGPDPHLDGVLRNPLLPCEDSHQKRVSKDNSAPNYLTMKKLHMR